MRVLSSTDAFLTELGQLLQRASAAPAPAPAAPRRPGSVWVTQKRLVPRPAPGAPRGAAAEAARAPLCLFRACGRAPAGGRVRVSCVVTRDQAPQFQQALAAVLRGGCAALRKVSKKDKKALQAAKKTTAAPPAPAAAAAPPPPPPSSPAKKR
jgi:hypothetical protein